MTATNQKVTASSFQVVLAIVTASLLSSWNVHAACGSYGNGDTYSWALSDANSKSDSMQTLHSDTDGFGRYHYRNHENCTWYLECSLVGGNDYPYFVMRNLDMLTDSIDDVLTIRPMSGGSITSEGRSYSLSGNRATYAPRVSMVEVRFVTGRLGTEAGFTMDWCCENEAGSCYDPPGLGLVWLVLILIAAIGIPIIVITCVCYHCCCKTKPPKHHVAAKPV